MIQDFWTNITSLQFGGQSVGDLLTMEFLMMIQYMVLLIVMVQLRGQYDMT